MKKQSNLLWLLLVETLMGFSLAVIFLKYPIFPSVLSGDFSQHMNTATILSHGVFPPFSNLILYYGIEFYLGLSVLLFPTVPLETVRLAMGLLVLVSPLIIYASVKQLFNSKAAIWSAALYTLSGSLWFGMVFNSGLWPNFWGVLSSLMLISAAVYFAEKKVGVFPLVLLVATLVNALFSHYSTLLVFFPLILYLGLKKNWLGVGILAGPLAIGFVLFPNLIFGLGAFIGASVGNAPNPTFLASLMVLPTLSFVVAEISANFLGDFGALAILFLGAFFLWRNWKSKDAKMLVVSLWFLIAILQPVYTANAWRFAFISLMPLMVMGGWSLSRLRPVMPKKVRNARNLTGKTLFFLFLIAFPAFGSWGNVSFTSATTNTSQVASQQQSDLRAIQWMLSNLPSSCDRLNITKCGVIVANDWNFQYLSYMDTHHYPPPLQGLQTYYAPGSGVVFDDALQTQLFASQFGRYILVSQYGTDSTVCNPSGTFGLTLMTDHTSIGVNETLVLTLTGLSRLNATVTLYDNGVQAVRVGFIDGYAQVATTYQKAGVHTYYLSLGPVLTYPLNVTVDSNPTPPQPKTVGVPTDYCQPWYSYNIDSMRGWKIVYQNEMVRLYEVTV